MPNVLTYDNITYSNDFSRRSSVVDQYKENMFLFLKRMLPQLTDQEIRSRINQICRERYKPNKLKYLQASSPCNIQVKEGGLLDVTNSLNEDILSPYGAAYCQVEKLKAVFSGYIEDNQAERKRVKKEMFLAECRGDKHTVFMNDLRQKNIKIKINAISGVMLSNVTFRSGINYNAITSTARFGIMTTYAMTEIALGSNYYFFSEDKAINWIVALLRVYPGDLMFDRCVMKYQLVLPSAEKVFEAYDEQIKTYHPLVNTDHLKQLIFNLSEKERAFVYYAMNMKRIFQENPIFRQKFDELIDVTKAPIIQGEIPNIAKLDDELVQTFTVILLSSDIKKTSLVDINAKDPDLSRKIFSVYSYIIDKFTYLEKLFETLLLLPILPSDIGLHKNMIRSTVLLSDTDSILFTTVNWIKWYTNSIRIDDIASNFNALIITLVSKMLEHVFAYMSASMNIGTENMRILNVKNEFMYDVFLRTAISKHYAGYVRFKEGIFQDPYKFDLKGKNFKGSDLCKETTSYVKWFIKYIFDSFLKTYELHPEDLISKVIVFEQRIKDSINNGETLFLMQKPINLKDQYANPYSSNYLYYDLWQDVFAQKYGDLNLPQKTKELPINEISIHDTKALHHMKDTDEEMYKRFIAFIGKFPKKKFSRVLIPMDMAIPEELRTIADYRKVCASNCYSLELILRSFNILGYPNKKNKVLFSDMYPTLLQELTDEQRREIRDSAQQFGDDEDYEEEDYDEEDDSEEEDVVFEEE
jgi:hypothetical protein